MANQNTSEYLEKIKTRLFEHLRMLPHAPGDSKESIPEDGAAVRDEAEEEDKASPDERLPQAVQDKRIAPENEFSDSDDEAGAAGPGAAAGGGGGRRDQRSFKGSRKRPRLDASGAASAKGATPAGSGQASAPGAAAASASASAPDADVKSEDVKPEIKEEKDEKVSDDSKASIAP
ncbi:hypothetical protein LSTR_LSTR001193 [Laodelphax striatellus]|uniref:Uncharacterized protein n=1 Tax=Laodelphax striatellus TaxID=195883 RepID=A0A482X1Y3_LAOST|nr:hypothetical protein LSTR_LSTR001193 [Laodelphax striatellus]